MTWDLWQVGPSCWNKHRLHQHHEERVIKNRLPWYDRCLHWPVARNELIGFYKTTCGFSWPLCLLTCFVLINLSTKIKMSYNFNPNESYIWNNRWFKFKLIDDPPRYIHSKLEISKRFRSYKISSYRKILYRFEDTESYCALLEK